MEKFLNIIINADIKDIKMVIVISVILLIIALKCIEALFLSKVELLLMSGSHSLKRTSFLYVIILGTCIFINLVFSIDKIFVGICMVYFFCAFVFYFIMKIFIKSEKCKKWFEQKKEDVEMFIVFTAFTSFISLLCYVIDAKANCIIFGSLVETIFLAMYPFGITSIESNYYIEIEGEKWYLLNRMTNALMLLGDSNTTDTSRKVRIMQFDELMNLNIFKDTQIIEDETGEKNELVENVT